MKNNKKLPVLFLGHGSPMNAIEENDEMSFFNDKLVAGSLSMTSLIIG